MGGLGVLIPMPSQVLDGDVPDAVTESLEQEEEEEKEEEEEVGF